MTAPLRIAIAGLGTVGAGTLALLARNAELLAARCGRPLAVVAVSARDRARELWGEAAPARDAVYLDLWDDYLERV